MLAAGPGARSMLCAAAVVAALASSRRAVAADKVACVEAAEAGQRLRKEGHLVSARDRLLVCASRECPDVVSQDCTGWLGEVQRSLGSVIVKARSVAGEPLSDVTVFLDGTELAERAPTAAIDVDPGPHVFRCERTGFAPAERQAQLSEGERGHEVDCALAPTAQILRREAVGSRADPRVFEALPPKPPETAPLPWVVWPLGGIALAGGASFAYFGLTGLADENTLRAKGGCAPYCTSTDLEPVRTKFVIADISLGVGVAALAVAAVVVLLHAGRSPTVPTAVKAGAE